MTSSTATSGTVEEHSTRSGGTQGAMLAVHSTRLGEGVKFWPSRRLLRAVHDRGAPSAFVETMPDPIFNVEEADALIPRLELLVEELQRLARELREEVGALAAESGRVVTELTMPEVLKLRPELHRVVEEINRSVQRIEDVGGVFKDLELGLVDFPTEIGGEPAYLCWQYGEKTIGFWHGIDDGFAGRRPLSARTKAPRRYLQ